ncbi:F0F1 ATP synthase subunit gamma [Alloacidobacterium dinghuense]|uniref:ATP synthase gamma chain n=1 Tax=Alloacidobacterium dinghuense TaxID=2763107 RepID=A0A7G8BHY6_9BACT|nr:FoF1 ATP synthase subunit gamma [Alloacidobacterium dinghuense]QNI32156.1 F0F1 ATP synthase subunit gamma [Alloacidobacterium dinghuense]
MANVLDLRRRIRSIKNTRQITKAMKMVAAAKLRRAQERAFASRPYVTMMASVLQSLKRRIEIYDPETGEVRHPLLLTRPEKNVLLLVISGEGGFAGAFNANIIKAATNFIAAHPDEHIDIEAIGRKGRDILRRRYPAAQYLDAQKQTEEDRLSRGERKSGGAIEIMDDHYRNILHKITFDEVRELGREIVTLYSREKIDAVYVVYNEFKSVIQQRVVVERILPIVEIGKQQVAAAEEMTREERERAAQAAASAGISPGSEEASAAAKEAEEEAQRFGTADIDYIYEQDPKDLFNAILPRYIGTLLYHAMIESVAAEFAARMTAMDSATNNASDLIDHYTLLMNRVRQAAITKELIEIVSGAAAL